MSTSPSDLTPVKAILVPMRGDHDCVIATLATYLGVRYEDVLVAAARVVPSHNGTDGFSNPQIRKIAHALGWKLTLLKSDAKWNTMDSTGVIVFRDHVALLMKGIIWDPNNSLWIAEHYLRHFNYTPLGLFVAKKETTTCE